MSESERLTSKLHRRRSEHFEHYIYWCPGCEEGHCFITKSPNFPDPWKFNGNIQSPSFTPSLLHKRSLNDYPGCGPRCHCVVTDGRILFCADSEHDLAGQTVEMVDIPGDYGT